MTNPDKKQFPSAWGPTEKKTKRPRGRPAIDRECRTCKYFHRRNEDRERGTCHRFPNFVVRVTYDWCGEWKSKGAK